MHAPTGLQPLSCKSFGHNAQTLQREVHKTTFSALLVWLICTNSRAQHLQLKRRSIAWRFWQWSVQDVNADVRRTCGYPGQKQQLSITLLIGSCKTHKCNASIGSDATYLAYSATSAALERCGSTPGADAFGHDSSASAWYQSSLCSSCNTRQLPCAMAIPPAADVVVVPREATGALTRYRKCTTCELFR
jgi:hypothetical protein